MLRNLLNDNPELLREIHHGLEKECLRVNSQGRIAQTFHPKELGKKLTNPSITTDYAENLLEFITGVHQFSTDDLLSELHEVQDYTEHILGNNEFLWPSSMPAVLPENDNDIPIADYGPSNVGQLKSIYRKGLGHRYGRSMQSIAGVHYNFSFSDKFWETLRNAESSDQTLREYKNKKYFDLIRNFKRHSWLLVYLFGASPAVDKSFLKNKDHNLDLMGEDTFNHPSATSLRMGGLGYTSAAQDDIKICFNHLDTYVKTIENARLQSVKEYEKIQVKKDGEYQQLNSNLLQIDNEFYSVIRPKNVAASEQSSLQALNEKGIEYIEVRLIDLDPFNKYGISKERIQFLHIFLTWCLFEPSDELTNSEYEELHSNFNCVVKNGRKNKLDLLVDGQSKSLESHGDFLFNSMGNYLEIFKSLDSTYQSAFENEKNKVFDKRKLPSNMLVERFSNKSFTEFNIAQAINYKTTKNLSDETLTKYQLMADQSEKDLKDIEDSDDISFDLFLSEYFKKIKI